MKRYQDVALFLLVLAIVAQTLHVMVRAELTRTIRRPRHRRRGSETRCRALTGHTEDSVPTTVSLVADRPTHRDSRLRLPSRVRVL